MKKINGFWIMGIIFFIIFFGFWIAAKIEEGTGKKRNTLTGIASLEKIKSPVPQHFYKN